MQETKQKEIRERFRKNFNFFDGNKFALCRPSKQDYADYTIDSIEDWIISEFTTLLQEEMENLKKEILNLPLYVIKQECKVNLSYDPNVAPNDITTKRGVAIDDIINKLDGK